ncbi:uncharacterized protein LOC135432060 isoform X2 [Drosophila montana]|uniref:uncharacterized protein LOC135432060 isoform X2 n=1 Tax=Drosophila montana TaxID=40370 RepID=UPI00313C0421
MTLTKRHRVPMLMPLLLLLLLVGMEKTRAELEPLSVSEPSTGLDEAQPARARIKAKTENMSSAGDSFNIRHGRSRAHMLHSSNSNNYSNNNSNNYSNNNSNNNSNNKSNSTRLALVSDAATLALPLPPPTAAPTQQPGAGGLIGAAVTHKIRKLHKKKINESIRKSVDKSLGMVRPVKNHRSLAEAEHLQGRPTDVDDTAAAALSEVMQLADEIDLENSLESAYQNVVVGLSDKESRTPVTEPATALATLRGTGAVKDSGAKAGIGIAAGRQFVRANSDDGNYEDSAEDEDELSTTPMATFAPRHSAANGPRSWQLQQTRVVGRTRLLPVSHNNGSNSRPDATSTVAPNFNLPVGSGANTLESSEADYPLEGSDGNTENADESEAGDDVDDNEDVTEAFHERSNSTEYAIVIWPETEAEVRSQASTSPHDSVGMEMKQINFNFGSESELELEPEADGEPVLDTSEVTMDDGYPPEVLIDDNTKPLVIDDVEGDGVDSNQITADVINARDNKIDLVSKFLQYIEQQHLMGSNCVAGTSLNLGEGVVDRYAQDRFRVEAEVAVNRANMLTRIFKTTAHSVQEDVNLLHASVLSMVEFDDDIFAAGNCFDWNEHPAQPGLFCPFAYRLPPPNLGAIFAKDLAMEYHYLGNTSEWFFLARKNAEKVIARNEQYLKSFHLYSNRTEERVEDDTLAVKYEDGRWSKPYYDCGGGNIWMLTYTVPFFGYENGSYHFKGTSGIDIDLRRVDIDQCPQRHTPGTKRPLNIFAGTDKCKQRTTMCEPIMGLGFRRGSYKCLCRKGFYFPDVASLHKFFNGSLLEEEYEKLMLGKNSTYNSNNEYECQPCAEGCDSCEDASPCIAALNWPMRSSILALACIVIGLLPPAAWFTFRYQQVKVVRAASPALLRVIALGAFFIYCTNIVMYPNPNLYTCTARIWLREIGFSLTYGALMLKTWRISVIFRVRSAKAVKITDAALLKRLGIICGAIGTCLLVRTLVSPPDVVVGRTADDLKAFLCKTDWWDYTFTSMEVLFLAWGVRLCIMVRKAPSEFNESRFISMAIYNEFLLTCFLNVSMLFLQSPANPDLLYIIFFCHTQLTVTLLLALIFGSKVYIVLRSGKSHQENIGMGAKASGAKFNFRPQVRTFAHPSSVTTSTAPAAGTTSAARKLLLVRFDKCSMLAVWRHNCPTEFMHGNTQFKHAD